MNTITNIRMLNWFYDNVNSIIIQYGNKNNSGVICKGYFIKNNKKIESKLHNDPLEIIKEFFNYFK